MDQQGNSNPIQTVRAGTAEHFTLVSVQGAAPDHPMECARMKYLAGQELRASGLAWTIIRPTAFMETWAAFIGEPLLKAGRTRIFGRVNNPIDFVSVYDAARFVELAVVDPAVRGELAEVGGPENISMRRFGRTFETETEKVGKRSHVPLPMMRRMAVLMHRVNPTPARRIQAGLVMDTHDMSFDPSDTNRRYRVATISTATAAPAGNTAIRILMSVLLALHHLDDPRLRVHHDRAFHAAPQVA